ncbi:hypothetical protein C8R45DRAFT_988361 [Mycena sanguinolenta]|nr:hypothetical protein C8R45DRAFT_988361 [Mycena sanguinolenta]
MYIQVPLFHAVSRSQTPPPRSPAPRYTKVCQVSRQLKCNPKPKPKGKLLSRKKIEPKFILIQLVSVEPTATINPNTAFLPIVPTARIVQYPAFEGLSLRVLPFGVLNLLQWTHRPFLGWPPRAEGMNSIFPSELAFSLSTSACSCEKRRPCSSQIGRHMLRFSKRELTRGSVSINTGASSFLCRLYTYPSGREIPTSCAKMFSPLRSRHCCRLSEPCRQRSSHRHQPHEFRPLCFGYWETVDCRLRMSPPSDPSDIGTVDSLVQTWVVQRQP